MPQTEVSSAVLTDPSGSRVSFVSLSVLGPPGATGALGANGATGAAGSVGPAGATGATGPAGSNGAVGSTGATGVIGGSGAAGAVGATGPAGATGASGVVGATGAAGPTGATGAGGASGVPRTSFSWQATNATSTTAARFLQAQGAVLSSEQGRYHVPGPTTIIRILLNILGTPYVTDNVTATLRKNGVDTALVATLTATSLSVSSTGSISVVAGDVLTMKIVQSGTEATTATFLNIVVSDT